MIRNLIVKLCLAIIFLTATPRPPKKGPRRKKATTLTRRGRSQ